MKTLRLFFACCLFSGILNAQDNTLRNGIGFGFQVSQYQKDFGIGINVTSPFFLAKHMAVRLRTHLVFNEHENHLSETTWTPYSNISLGMVGVGGMVGDFIRLYGEGGSILLLPSPVFSSEQTLLGGYGLFGFEFFIARGFNYFLEVGGVGTGAVADKVVKKPIYSNGLMISVGLRVTL